MVMNKSTFVKLGNVKLTLTTTGDITTVMNLSENYNVKTHSKEKKDVDLVKLPTLVNKSHYKLNNSS
jgi:hypothetical protein